MKENVALINPQTPLEIRKALTKKGYSLLPIPLCKSVADPLQGHPDLQICPVFSSIVFQPHIDSDFLKELPQSLHLIEGKSSLEDSYPFDIAYNAAITSSAAFHRKDITDLSLTQVCDDNDIEIIHVSQGYTKCSTAIVSDNAVITADKGIYNAAMNTGLSVLLIEPGFINLPGYKYGFIGGATGCDKKRFYVAGTLAEHPDYRKIISFVENQEKEYTELGTFSAIDLGSIFLF